MSSPSVGTARSGQAKIVALVASTDGSGCTSTVANLACAMAGHGRKVLVIDWGSDSPRVPEYLVPFETDRIDLPARLVEAWAADRRDEVTRADPAPMRRFAVPDASGYIDVIEMRDADGAERYPRLLSEGAEVGAGLRRVLPVLGYDHVLIDTPVAGTARARQLIATVCDMAVMCFLPRTRAIQAAAELAADIKRRAPIRIDIVPVVTAFDDDHPSRSARIRAAINNAFLPVTGDRDVDGPAVHDIPTWSFGPFDPLVAILAEEPSRPDEPPSVVLDSYGRLLATVTDGELNEIDPVSAELRARYRSSFGLTSRVDPVLIRIVYATQDRPWADWVRALVERAGVRTSLVRVGGTDTGERGGTVVIASAAFDLSDRHDTAAAMAGAESAPFWLVVDDSRHVPGEAGSATVVTGAEDLAIGALLTHFQLFHQLSADARPMPLPPTDRPKIFEAPPRNRQFVGRDDAIEDLRDRFTARADEGVVVTVGGVPGVGKSELALEYVHRFAGDYNLVWWLSAADEPSVLLGLARLAGRLQIEGSRNFGSTAALRELATKAENRRFLLVYDNLADESALADMLPRGHHGHVIVTSSERDASDVELTPMTPADSVQLLMGRTPGLRIERAESCAGAVSHLPIAVELAASWLSVAAAREQAKGTAVDVAAEWAAREFLERLGDPETDDGGWQRTVSRVVAMSTAAMAQEGMTGRIAVVVAELCSFLSQDSISLDLVRSKAMFRRVRALCGPAVDDLLLDSWEIDRALWLAVHYGVFRVDWGRQNVLRVHRTVQTAIRDAMSTETHGEKRAATLTVLADFAPVEVEENRPGTVERFTELQQHVYPSNAVASDDPAVRRWLVNQVRYLYLAGGSGVHRAAVGPAQKLLDDWTSRYGPAEILRLRLSAQVANLYRALGDHEQALRLDDRAMVEHRRSLAPDHPQALISARGRSADLRGLGRFGEALTQDREVWERLRDTFGEDHRQTQMAAGNLASSLLLAGQPWAALRVARGNHRRRLRLFGDEDQSTSIALAQVGVYLRELGDYDESVRVLNDANQRLPRQGLNERELSVRWHLAISMRCQGKALAAKDKTRKAMLDYRELFGPEHPNTLACTVSYASALRAVGGDEELTVGLVTGALAAFRDSPRFTNTHPFVALCLLGVGLARCSAGLDGTDETGAALELLTEQLDDDAHPWTLAAAIDHARVLAAAGQRDAAYELVDDAYERCLEYLGTTHPHTKIAEHNRSVASSASSSGQNWKEIDVDVPEI